MKLSSHLSIAAALLAASVIPAQSSASDLAPSNVLESAIHTPSAAHGDLLRFLMQPVGDSTEFESKRIAIVASDGASAFELELTRDYFMNRGARVHILAPRPVEGAPMVGLAGFVPPRELLTTLDYAGERRLATVTWYLDQVKPQDYDAIYVPNNLTDIERLASNSQTIRFLITAQGTQRPIFVTGNGRASVPDFEISGLTRPASVASANPPAQIRQWRVYAGEDAFDMPELIGALAATLTATPAREIN